MAGLVQVVQKPLSTEQPTEKDAKLSEGLMALMNSECLIPTQDESNRRVKAIGKLNEMVRLKYIKFLNVILQILPRSANSFAVSLTANL